MIILEIILFFIILMFLHEAGHVLSAKILGLSVRKVGVSIKPYPHFYVSVDWPHKIQQKYLYLFAGMFSTLTIFCIGLFFSFWSNNALLYALALQIVIETNPFHSDIIIAILTNKKVFKETSFLSFKEVYQTELKKYYYTTNWYIHFILWTILIILLLRFVN